MNVCPEDPGPRQELEEWRRRAESLAAGATRRETELGAATAALEAERRAAAMRRGELEERLEEHRRERAELLQQGAVLRRAADDLAGPRLSGRGLGD